MNSVDEAVVIDGLALRDELRGHVDERVLQLLERRRSGGVIRRRGWLMRRYLLSADVVGFVGALILAETLGGSTPGVDALRKPWELLAIIASLPLWIVVAKLYALYDHDEEWTDHSTADEFSAVFHAVTVCTFLFWGWSRLSHVVTPQPLKLIIFWASAIVLGTAGRAVARAVARGSLAYLQNTVIVGAGEVGQTIAAKLLKHPEYGINLIGFVDAQLEKPRVGLEHVAVLGDLSRLPTLIQLFDVERVIIAFPDDSHEVTVDLVRSLSDLRVQVDYVPRLFELVGPGVGLRTVEGLPLVGLPPSELSRSSKLLKRCLDLGLAIPALVVLSPLFFVIGLLIKLDSRGPVFFRQVRMGAGDETFQIYKFRSMTADAEEQKSEVAHLNKHLADGDARRFKIVDDPRVTRVGRMLRRSSLDELPQLWNVVRGEMSLVGPRPLPLEEDCFITDWGRRRLSLRPGMTGLWQVLGRSEISFEEMVRLDYVYVTSWSLARDVRLILRTLPLLARPSRGAY